MWDRDFRQASSQTPGMACPSVVPAKGSVPLTAIGVHRVALIGDSIMEQSSCTVATSLASVGVQTERDAVAGSGLLTGFVNWPMRTKQILDTYHPDVVVAIFVGNYFGPPVRDSDGHLIGDNTPAFFDAWQSQAERLSAEVLGAGAQMFWVSPPPLFRPPLNHADRLFDGYRSISGDHTLPSGSVLAGSKGQWVLSKPTCGHVEIIRNPMDDTHLTDAGARLYGEQIAHDLTEQLGILTTPKPC
ncbi:MAG: hypothetical protein JO368_02650 [Acidimicrobiales bacterium]|nr:hypothetical protein [Acidimicrobiales bacterium]